MLSAGRRVVFSIVAALILVFGIFAALKMSTSGKQAPARELHTGSIQKSPAVRKSPSTDPMAAFLTPHLTQPIAQSMQSTAVNRGAIPLPRPRPNRL
jgi:hypothetical protein